MHFRSYFILFYLLILSSFGGLFAQPIEDEEESKDIEMLLNNGPPPLRGWRYQIMADISSPHLVYNPANARAFDGIAHAQLFFGRQIVGNWHAGIYGRYTGFNTYNPSQVGDTLYINLLRNSQFGGGAYVTYQHIFEPGIAVMGSIQGGYQWIRYQNIKVNNSFIHRDFYDWTIQLSGGVFYYPFENRQTAVGLTIGSTYFNHRFDKEVVNFIEEYSSEGPSIHLNIGLSVMFYLGARNN